MTSPFQKRMTRQPRASSMRVRAESRARALACWPPSTSITSLREGTAKSAMWRPMGCWRRTLAGSAAPRNARHRMRSASVASLRSFRARRVLARTMGATLAPTSRCPPNLSALGVCGLEKHPPPPDPLWSFHFPRRRALTPFACLRACARGAVAPSGPSVRGRAEGEPRRGAGDASSARAPDHGALFCQTPLRQKEQHICLINLRCIRQLRNFLSQRPLSIRFQVPHRRYYVSVHFVLVTQPIAGVPLPFGQRVMTSPGPRRMRLVLGRVRLSSMDWSPLARVERIH